ncbi:MULTISPECIES: ABC transporter permease [Stenotrophomonas]|uniref:ABC transporter permease n=1 Tax=Stenotrophomonas lactitubi TaxID=2045214 RepID=A0AAW4GIL3_9GAMM|nr:MULTISPECIES: ABC transporter permease [Stenotrophomonas]MBM9913864.1 ABC transporter permease [Stenotrophomonas lactitubi]MBM9921857.1 ABC transporter permease [Stenotrophomonas lactitubi]MBM9938971.1 ABC transporter permease [Stenotrophomonas lactitubi]
MAAALNTDRGSFGSSWQRELRRLRSNRADLALVTVLPLLMLVVMAWMFSASVMRDVPIAVVDLDHSSDSRLLLRMLDASPGVRIASQPAGMEEARGQLRRLEVFAVVLVPRDVTRQALRGQQGTVFSYYNATYMTTGQSAARDIGDAVSAWNARLLRERIGLQVGPGKLRAAPIAVQSDILFNPARSYELFLLPLIFPAVLSLVLALAVAGSLGREIRDGTLPAWLGHAPWSAIAGKVLPYVLLFSLYGALGAAYLAWLRGDGIAGSVVLLLLAQPLFYLATAAYALFFVGVTRDMGTALSAVGLSIGTALAFSSATFPVIDAPLFTRVWHLLLPLSAYIKLQTQQQFIGSPLVVSLWPLATLLLMIAVAGGTGGWRLMTFARTPQAAQPAGAGA